MNVIITSNNQLDFLLEIADTNIEMLAILKQYFRPGLKAAEAARRIW